MKGHMKGITRAKEITKSTMEKKNVEEDEFKRYDGIINKLAQEVTHNDKPTYQVENNYSTSKRNPSVATRSNMKLTVSRTKDEKNDKEFLTNLINIDNITGHISPNNLHLLSDDDRNKSISNTEKYKNLSDLMIDDRDSHIESIFIKNSEERMILNLYSILGRKSKQLFLEEDSPEKISKIRLLFNKFNNIIIPKFEFKQNTNINFNYSKKVGNIDLSKSSREQEDEINSEMKSNISDMEEKKEKIEYPEDEIKKEKEKLYFKQKQKASFIIPDLVDLNKYKTIKRTTKQTENFWDPEIDADTLSNINHNMICIEDIYNKKETSENKDDNINNDKYIEINAEEIVTSESESEENNKELKDEEENIKKGKIRFVEFYDVSPVQMGLSYIVDNNKVKENIYSIELKVRNDLKLDKIAGIEDKQFPKRGYELSNDLIYRIALRNDNNEIVEGERFSIPIIHEGLDKYVLHKKNLDKESKKRIIIERKGNVQTIKGKLTEEPLTLKKTNKIPFKSISDYAGNIKNRNNIKLEEISKEKIDDKEKKKGDSLFKINNNIGDENEDTLKDLINNESLFSNKQTLIDKNNNDENSQKSQSNKNNDKKSESSYNSSKSNSSSKEKQKNLDNNIDKLDNNNESSSQKNENSKSESNLTSHQ